MDLPSCVRSSFLIPQESELSKKRKKCESLEQEARKKQRRCEELVSSVGPWKAGSLGPSGPPGGGLPQNASSFSSAPTAHFPSCLVGLPFPS